MVAQSERTDKSARARSRYPMAVQPSRTVTDSRNFMHLLTPEQLQLERNHSKKDMTR